MADSPFSSELFDWMQKMWTPMSFPMPGVGMPTLDVNEITRKIAELKAVETWLTMNVGFVQMTVQTLEMQKSALESIKTAAQPR